MTGALGLVVADALGAGFTAPAALDAAGAALDAAGAALDATGGGWSLSGGPPYAA